MHIARVRRDPYEYRRLLTSNQRLLPVLELAAEKAGWSKHPPQGVFRGIACTEAFKTHIAHAVEQSVNNNEETVAPSKGITAITNCHGSTRRHRSRSFGSTVGRDRSAEPARLDR
jgi:hypothetical protein